MAAKKQLDQKGKDALDLDVERSKLWKELVDMNDALRSKANWSTPSNELEAFERSQAKRRAEIKREFRKLDRIEEERTTRERLTARKGAA